MEKTQIYGVVLPLEIARKARIVAAAQGLSRSRLIRLLLESYLQDIPVADLTAAASKSPLARSDKDSH